MTNFEREQAREIAKRLMQKYILPNMEAAHDESIFFEDTGYEVCSYDELTASIDVCGYFSQTEVKEQTNPFYDDPIECGESSIIEEGDIVVRKKKKSKLSSREIDNRYDKVFDEENFVAYNYSEKVNPEDGLVHFKVTFKFWS